MSSVARALSRVSSEARIFVTKIRAFQKSATCLQIPTLAGRPDEDQIASILSAIAQIPEVATFSKKTRFFWRAKQISSLLRGHHLSPHLLRDVYDEFKGNQRESKGVQRESKGVKGSSKGIQSSKGVNGSSKGVRRGPKGAKGSSNGVQKEFKGSTKRVERGQKNTAF